MGTVGLWRGMAGNGLSTELKDEILKKIKSN